MTTPAAADATLAASCPYPSPGAPGGAALPELVRIARLAARILDAPATLVTLVGEDGEMVAAGVGLRAALRVGAALPLSAALPLRAGEPGRLALADSRRRTGPHFAALARSGVVACLAHPFLDGCGTLRGTLAAIDFLPRSWGKDEVAVLGDLAMFAGSAVELTETRVHVRQANGALEAARAALTSAGALRRVAEQPPVGLVTLEEGRICWANSEFARTVGYTLDELMSMESPEDLLFDGTDRERMLRQAATLEPGAGSVHVCTPLRRRDGSSVRVELRLGRVAESDRFLLVGAVQDVSIAAAEDERLRADLARFRRAFDDDLCGVVIAAADCRIIACNAEFARITGFPSAEAAVGVALNRLEPEPGELAARVGRLRRERGSTEPGELELIRRDGTRVKVVARLAADFDPGGAPAEYRGYLVDVTQRALREEALRLTGERLRLLELATNDVTWDWDLTTGQMTWNDAGPLRLRYAPDEVQPSLAWHFERVHPHDRERVVAGLHEAISGVAQAWTDEYRFLRGDGTYATVHDRAHVMRNSRGEPVRVTGWMVDVTERKRGEEAQRFLAQASATLDSSLNVGITATNLVRLCIPVLADFCALDLVAEDGAVQRVAVAHHRHAREHLLAADAHLPAGTPAGTNPVAQVARTGEPVLRAECDEPALAALDASLGAGHARRLGTHSYMLVPVVAHERVLAVLTLGLAQRGRRYGPMDLMLAKDLAHRAALSLENARLYETAQRALGAREEILGVVSHDLRSPLSAIVMSTEALADDSLGSRMSPHQWIDMIRRAADQMNALIDDLLDVSSMEAGRFEVVPSLQDLPRLLAESCEQFYPICKVHDLKLECLVDGEFPLIALDARQIRRVIGNLIGNAIKFSRRGGVIRVRVEHAEGELWVAVSDEGVGISEEHLPHVFDRFWKANQVDRRGAGLGLAISRGIVEAHGGRIWVDSPVGVGSTFRFSLPLPEE